MCLQKGLIKKLNALFLFYSFSLTFKINTFHRIRCRVQNLLRNTRAPKYKNVFFAKSPQFPSSACASFVSTLKNMDLTDLWRFAPFLHVQNLYCTLLLNTSPLLSSPLKNRGSASAPRATIYFHSSARL